MPQSFIGVHVVDILPVARQVNVEPCTPDDWELIQLHAGLIEGEILRQVIMCLVGYVDIGFSQFFGVDVCCK